MCILCRCMPCISWRARPPHLLQQLSVSGADTSLDLRQVPAEDDVQQRLRGLQSQELSEPASARAGTTLVQPHAPAHLHRHADSVAVVQRPRQQRLQQPHEMVSAISSSRTWQLQQQEECQDDNRDGHLQRKQMTKVRGRRNGWCSCMPDAHF